MFGLRNSQEKIHVHLTLRIRYAHGPSVGFGIRMSFHETCSDNIMKISENVSHSFDPVREFPAEIPESWD